MKKRIVMMLLAAVLMINLLPFGAIASETEETTEATEAAADPNAQSGTCGDNLTWVLEGNTLTISGKGEMADGMPWETHAQKIEKLVLTGGVTKIGKKAFYECDRLESIDFGDALVEIGEQAFYGCDDITTVHLPVTFRIFGQECFRGCESLQKIYCDGPMPRFNSSCLWTGNYISVFYPTNYAWPQEAVSQLISNFGGRLGIMMGNYDASALSETSQSEEEEKEEETKPTETEPAATEAPAEVPTEAPTEAPTQPAIVLIVPETEPEETTVPPTTEAEAETIMETEAEPETDAAELEEAVRSLEGKSWIGMVMIAGVITFLLIGALIFRSISKKGGKYNR